MSSFKSCLKLGQYYEEKTIAYYIDKGYHHIKDGNYKKKCLEYDIIISKDDIETKIEVKADRLARKTGNIYIEYESNKKPSGISTSTSNIYVYYIINDSNDYNMYIIPTIELKEMIDAKTYFKKVSGGDGWRSRGYLFKIANLGKYKV
jgi:hypothetical protein